MPVVVSVVGAAVVAFALLLIAEWTGPNRVMGDPEQAERRLVARARRTPLIRHAVAAVDRYFWGSSMVAVGLVAVALSAAVVGWIFTTVDDNRGFARFDESLAEWGSANATETSTDLLQIITTLGGSALLIPLTLVVGLILVRHRLGTNWSILGFLLTVSVGVTVLNNGLKWIVMRDRPTIDQLVESSSSSFPSGHSASAAAVWAALAFVLSSHMHTRARQSMLAAAGGIGVLVAASRVMLGVHWLTDVIAGVLVGWTWFFVVALIFGGRLQRFGEPAERIETGTATGEDATAQAAQESERVAR